MSTVTEVREMQGGAEARVRETRRKIEELVMPPLVDATVKMLLREQFARLLQSMRDDGIGGAVIARVRRLNPDWTPGSELRGWHPNGGRRGNNWWHRQLYSKGEIIRKHGREAWENCVAWDRRSDEPRHSPWRRTIIRKGRRHYITREAYLDNVWTVPPKRFGY